MRKEISKSAGHWNSETLEEEEEEWVAQNYVEFVSQVKGANLEEVNNQLILKA